MIAAIMQPYFFPYIGYFQLMRAVDVFVFFDNVQYINRGWVNRNQIPLHGKPTWLTLPVVNASRSLLINQRFYLLGEGVEPIKQKLRAAYPDRMNSAEAKLINELLDYPDPNVASFNANLLRRLAQIFGISCKFMVASKLADLGCLSGEDKVIELCRRVGASHYINPIGGVQLYDPSRFADAEIQLSFLRTTSMPTEMAPGVVHYSVIDALMQHDASDVTKMLDQSLIISGA